MIKSARSKFSILYIYPRGKEEKYSFLLILKAKQLNPKLTKNAALVCGIKTSAPLERDWILKIAFRTEKSFRVLGNARQASNHRPSG